MASSVALYYAKILANLKITNDISLIPLNCTLNAFTIALKDQSQKYVSKGLT